MKGEPQTKIALASAVWRRLFDFIIDTAAHRNRVLGRYDLTPNDARAVFALHESEGRTMGSLAEEWGCDASYATSVVDRLEHRGLARRRNQPGDRRVKLVVLTPDGAKTKHALTSELYRPPRELMQLGTADLKTLWHATAKLRIPTRE
jgi:DNA-binding MarR family transcriptional regulator